MGDHCESFGRENQWALLEERSLRIQTAESPSSS